MKTIHGYAGNILKVNLSTGGSSTEPTEKHADRFLGGRGIALDIHLHEVPPHVHAFDPENRLAFMTGPLCGVIGLAGSRWQATGKSPVFNRFSYANLGGAWGAQLKASGYDGLVFHGRADKLIYLVIDDGKVEIKDASHLQGRGAIQTRRQLKDELGSSFRVAAIGPAGENQVHFASILADSDSNGGGGLGAVMGSKNLKAVAVRGSRKTEPAYPDQVDLLRKRVREIKPPPVFTPIIAPQERRRKDMCYGCIDGCHREVYTAENGDTGKYMCQSALFYEVRSQRYYGEINDVPFQATKMSDDYGVDTKSLENIIKWLVRASKSGLVNEKQSGLPLDKIGSFEFVESLLNRISFREGFGDLLAQGAFKTAAGFGPAGEALITDYMIKSGENQDYDPRLYITTGLLYALEYRQPIQQLHEVALPILVWAARETGQMDSYMTTELLRKIADRCWGGQTAVDFSTYRGKARAAVMVQNRQYAKESLILCDFSWPILHSPVTEDHLGDPALESRILRAVTGLDVDESGLYRYGERAFNLQRAALVREGVAGRDYDRLEEYLFNMPLKGDWGNMECLVPGQGGQPFSRKGTVVDRDEFEQMKDEYYQLRGWDVKTGLQTRDNLESLDLADVADILAGEGLLA